MNPKGPKSVITVTIISGDTPPITSAPKKCSLFKACLKETGTHRIWGRTSQCQTPMWQHTVSEWGRFPSHSKICPLLTYAYPQINTPLGAGRASSPKTDRRQGSEVRMCLSSHTVAKQRRDKDPSSKSSGRSRPWQLALSTSPSQTAGYSFLLLYKYYENNVC